MAARYGYSRRTSGYREHWYSYIDWFQILVVVGVIAGVGGLAWMIVLSAQEQGRWETWCVTEAGGRIDKETDLGVGYSNGKPVTTTSTTYYCLTDDGRILDIKG